MSSLCLFRNQLSLNFKTSSVLQWGADVCASRCSEELRLCRPPFVEARAVEPPLRADPELLGLSLEQLKECLKARGGPQRPTA